MKLRIFSLLLLVGWSFSAPTAVEDDDKPISVDKSFFHDSLKVYTGEHDIVKIVVPLNSLNFDEDDDDDDDDSEGDSGLYIFFVEADVKEDGEKDYKGLFVYKNGTATKILENGRDAASSNDNSRLVFLGAEDGIYVFDEKELSAKKYGSLTDNIIAIAKENGTDIIYILTEDHHVYKVSDEGNVKIKIDEIKDAQDIVLDFANNLYYYDSNKHVYVYDKNGVKKIEGLPPSTNYLRIIKPPFVIGEGVPVIIDNKSYIGYSNGTSEIAEFILNVHPTAYAMEATLIEYFAYNKNIYEYNILVLLLGNILQDISDDLDAALTKKKEEIQEIGTKSRSNFIF